VPTDAELKIAWARALSRAFDDPQYYRRLKTNRHGVVKELGFNVTEQTVDGLEPTLDDLDAAIASADRQRAMLRAAEPASTPSSIAAPTFSVVPVPYAQPVVAPQPVVQFAQPAVAPQTVGPQPVAAFAAAARPPAPFFTLVNPYTYGSQSCVLGAWASIAASQVATTRASARSAPAPPQRFGGPPSGGVLTAS
jgi:hypothetical protein